MTSEYPEHTEGMPERESGFNSGFESPLDRKRMSRTGSTRGSGDRSDSNTFMTESMFPDRKSEKFQIPLNESDITYINRRLDDIASDGWWNYILSQLPGASLTLLFSAVSILITLNSSESEIVGWIYLILQIAIAVSICGIIGGWVLKAGEKRNNGRGISDIRERLNEARDRWEQDPD